MEEESNKIGEKIIVERKNLTLDLSPEDCSEKRMYDGFQPFEFV